MSLHREPSVGDRVSVYKYRGEWYPGVIVWVGRTRVRVAFKLKSGRVKELWFDKNGNNITEAP